MILGLIVMGAPTVCVAGTAVLDVNTVVGFKDVCHEILF